MHMEALFFKADLCSQQDRQEDSRIPSALPCIHRGLRHHQHPQPECIQVTVAELTLIPHWYPESLVYIRVTLGALHSV